VGEETGGPEKGLYCAMRGEKERRSQGMDVVYLKLNEGGGGGTTPDGDKGGKKSLPQGTVVIPEVCQGGRDGPLKQGKICPKNRVL